MKNSSAICSIERLLSPPSVAGGRSGEEEADGSEVSSTSEREVMGSPGGEGYNGSRGYGPVTYGDVSMAAVRHAARGLGKVAPEWPPILGVVGQRGPQASSTPPDVLKHCKEPHL
ncbi:hypothetical protein GCM10010393_30200 [Streptomyces gobitricini]|uniref:Uncharacterized protein n=1 Tax=Streptomyces gobitricini TaxID=68211 RepID=A0ABN3M607_9ACTN